MKIAASDFDGTLNDNEKGISPENVAAISEWQADGNKFGLVTGRNLELARLGLENYDIKLDFCVGLNGAVVFDENEQEIFGAELPMEVIEQLWAHDIAKESPYVMLLQGKKTFAHWNTPSQDNPLRHAGLTEVTREESLEIPHVMQMCFAAASAERAEELAADINRRFGKLVTAEVNLHYVDVCSLGNDKGTGLVQLQAGMGWESYPLYVIGDDLNDLSMIERFEGFAMENANPLVKEKAKATFISVGEMLRYVQAED
ncbi:MAG: HAD-IIB family hydrolase [Selenomonadaceae bacterium]|nr:HAD-IIB family hydrolase [Selenomonadaceae bacterium]